MAKRWRGIASPYAGSEGSHGCVEAAEGAEDQEHVDVGGRVIDGGGGVGDFYIASRAGVDVYLVVSCTLGMLAS